MNPNINNEPWHITLSEIPSLDFLDQYDNLMNDLYLDGPEETIDIIEQLLERNGFKACEWKDFFDRSYIETFTGQSFKEARMKIDKEILKRARSRKLAKIEKIMNENE